MISSNQLRTLFLNYFEEKGHLVVPSSSLVPTQEEKSLLFVNAGMVPFKPMFSNIEVPPATNVTSIQRCLRAGGKHNDLDNVGYTARHHTFFEMLGNFSFGGYFKREAIQLAFDFLTITLKIPKEKLWVTVHKDDQETADIWLKELKFDISRLSYCDDKDNFWMMGDTGPCGPCTEIFYDHGESISGGPPGSEDADGDRYVEIWNLVFMQYEQQPDGQRVNLPTPCVDTGMGLERLTAVMQHVVSNYDTDLFQPLIEAARQLMPQGATRKAQTLRVIADHMRAIGVLIADGVLPSNEGRGYVLRRIIRRALRHGYQAGIRKPFLYQLLPTLTLQMQSAFSELAGLESHVKAVLFQEEQQFLKTLRYGLQYFNKTVKNLPEQKLPGHLVFKLYDTYGFPADLTADLAREINFSWDQTGFKDYMQEQKERSKTSQHFKQQTSLMSKDLSSVFKGYTQLNHSGQVIALLNKDKVSVKTLSTGQSGYVVLNQTPFYAEAGGQVGDQGELIKEKDQSIDARFIVLDTQKEQKTHLHEGYIKQGELSIGDRVYSQVDQKRRQGIRCHHSATHLLHAALRHLLGVEVVQKGSLVTPHYLRFDFQYRSSLTLEDIQRIESQVNQAIWKNLPIKTQLMSLEAAKKTNAIALFNEKYTGEVRVLSIGDISNELCGGTHADHTGELGLFKITLSTSIAASVKRIEAVVGEAALEWVTALEARQSTLAMLFKTNAKEVVASAERQIATSKRHLETIDQLTHYICNDLAHRLKKESTKIGEATVVLASIPDFLNDQARSLIDQLKSILPVPSVIVIGCVLPERLSVSISVTKQYTSTINAKDVVALLIRHTGGKGGGRPDFAQVYASLDQAQPLSRLLDTIHAFLIEQINVG